MTAGCPCKTRLRLRGRLLPHAPPPASCWFQPAPKTKQGSSNPGRGLVGTKPVRLHNAPVDIQEFPAESEQTPFGLPEDGELPRQVGRPRLLRDGPVHKAAPIAIAARRRAGVEMPVQRFRSPPRTYRGVAKLQPDCPGFQYRPSDRARHDM